MKAAVERGAIVLEGRTTAEARQLRLSYERGHVHLVCKALTYRGGRTGRVTAKLILVPSVIAWQRPTKKAR